MLATVTRLFAGKIRPHTLARLTLPVNILFIILLAHSLAQLSWKLFSSHLAPPPVVAEPAGSLPTQLTDDQHLDYSAIVGWHLFGQASETKAITPSTQVSAPETTLNLKLVGVFFTKDGNRALAIIAEGGGEELSYTIGEQLAQSRARLEQILRDRVVLSRNGRLETLSLPNDAEGGEGGEGGEGAPVFDQQRPSSETQDTITNEETSSANLPLETVNVSAIASRFRDKALNHPQELQDLALAAPYVQNGQFMGFRLRPGRDRALLGQLGLRAGDIVTTVNGTRLDDPVKGLGMLQELANASQINIQVLRNGAEIPFAFILNNAQ